MNDSGHRKIGFTTKTSAAFCAAMIATTGTAMAAPNVVTQSSAGDHAESPQLPTQTDLANVADLINVGGKNSGPTNMGLTEAFGGEKVEPFTPKAGRIRTEFGGWGPHSWASTKESLPCNGIFTRVYEEIIRDGHGVTEAPSCLRTFPGGYESPVGFQFIYPTDLSSGEKAPLIVLSPGIITDPGMLYQHAEKLASHGYIVSLGYNFSNWFGPQVVAAAIGAVVANQLPESAIYDRVDSSQTVLIGHSAGGGSVARIGGSMDAAFRRAGVNFTTRGVIPINPGPSDFSLASAPLSVPSLFLIAENESLVPHQLSRIDYDEARAPSWWAVVSGAYHGTYLDKSDGNAYDGLQLSFIDYVLNHSADTSAVYEGANFGLAADSELKDVERKGI